VILHVCHLDWLVVPDEIIVTSPGMVMTKTHFIKKSFNVPERPIVQSTGHLDKRKIARAKVKDI